MRNTQLILYPQFAIGNNGFSFTATQTQYLANSSFTSALQNSTQVGSVSPLFTAISTNASLIGNWQGFSTDSSVFAAASVPFVSNGNLNLPSSGSALSFQVFIKL